MGDTKILREELLQRIKDGHREETAEMKAVLQRLLDENASIRQDNAALHAAVERLQRETASMKEESLLLKRHLVNSESRYSNNSVLVAFSVASTSGFGPVTQDSNIPFDLVTLNVGDAWKDEDAHFEAPVAGIYQFTASMVSHSTSPWAYVHIVHTDSSGTVVMARLRGGDGGSDANSVVMELQEGDVVAVQLEAGDGFTINGSRYTTFSGFLLL